MKAVIYARYSSDSQREESIEGQLRECFPSIDSYIGAIFSFQLSEIMLYKMKSNGCNSHDFMVHYIQIKCTSVGTCHRGVITIRF